MMQFNLTLSLPDKQNRVLPVNYQYPLSAWIYKTIHQGNHEFAEFLHSKGFALGERTFKFFTFSRLQFPDHGFHITGDRMHIDANTIQLRISFLVPEAMQHFVSGLFKNQQFELGDKISRVAFVISSIEAQSIPCFTGTMTFRTLSPIVISHHIEDVKTAAFIAPDDERYEQFITDNLTNKYLAAMQSGLVSQRIDFNNDHQGVRFKLLGKTKMNGIFIKAGTPQQTKIIGYLFDFQITAPTELIRIGYYAGFGEKNSLGMGSCRCLASSIR
ncbi:MAG: CRISPR-associated endoribonuclease Cas6 [Bacteroidales bacterium]|nr:CRISPR-associated endoribonuclease Cas6 [Bacteroidales bacterium]